ncbi:MAG: APC family permease [Steroidobacteraceae bacterium]
MSDASSGNSPPQTLAVPEPLARELSALGVWLLVINGMLGAGIFGLPAAAARLAGAFSPWVFLICGAVMLLVMLCFAELAARFEGTGGPLRYVGAAFGPFAGFQAGWAFYVARLTAFAANASLLVGSLGYFWPAADSAAVRFAVLLLVCASLTAITALGTRKAIGSLGLLTCLKLAPLAGLVLVGFALAPESIMQATRFAPPVHADLGAAIVLVLYAYVGFESGLVPAGEARDPRRDMPRALFWAIGVIAALYFVLQAVSVATLPGLGEAARPLVEVGGALLGSVGAAFMMGGLAASVLGNMAGALLATSRISYALALDHRLPRAFAAVSPRFGTPLFSILVFGGLGFALAAAGSFVWLAGLSVLARVLLYLSCIAALPALRRAAPEARRMRVLPGGLAIPVLAALTCLALLTQVKGADWAATAILLGVGSVLYAVARRARPSP